MVTRTALDSPIRTGVDGMVSSTRQPDSRETIPYIPHESELDQLITGNRKKIGCFLQFLKESACKPIEAWRLTPEDFDLKQQICYINEPAKGSNPRIFKMGDKLTACALQYI